MSNPAKINKEKNIIKTVKTIIKQNNLILKAY